MDLSKMTRRDFHKSATLGVTSLALSAGPAVHNVIGANDRIGVGLIGSGNQGRFDLTSMMRTGQVDPIAAADVYTLSLAQTLDGPTMPPGKTAAYSDFRKLLDRKDIDAVIVATPEHWHGIPMIMACEAGKDVYVEKPTSHTIYEGRKMVEAANKYNRVVTCGTQQRSGEHYQKVAEMIRGGKIGKVTYVEAFLYGLGFTRESRKQMPPPDSDPPAGFDWDFWLGPAPYHHYNRSRRGFTGFWETGGGETTNWGPHLMDVVHWAMQVDAPLTVACSGARYASEGIYETPDTFEALYEYPSCPLNSAGFLARLSYHLGRGPDDHSYGTQFYGTDGTLFINREGYTIWPAAPIKDVWETFGQSDVIKGDGTAQHQPHVENFLECMRSRKIPNADIETTHRTTSVCHLANISLRLGRKLRWDRDKEQFVGDADANKMLNEERRKPWNVI
jgi:predicted dehydrogenase